VADPGDVSRFPRITIAVLISTSAACSSGVVEGPALVFGEIEGGCGVTVLTNDVDDQEKLRGGVDCLIAHIDAGDPVEWDLLVPTVEGDPILYRFASDGATVTITQDASRDRFGGSGVLVEICETVDDTGFVPVGAGCTASGALPFDLPDGIWPP
jgi:hypothetical protein